MVAFRETCVGFAQPGISRVLWNFSALESPLVHIKHIRVAAAYIEGKVSWNRQQAAEHDTRRVHIPSVRCQAACQRGACEGFACLEGNSLAQGGHMHTYFLLFHSVPTCIIITF